LNAKINDNLKQLIKEKIEQYDVKPAYYALSGSHLYGYASESSDIDVRGFHIAPGEQYLTLNTPKSQYEVDEIGEKDIDLVSYELKKFTRLVRKLNFNVLECIHSNIKIYNSDPQKISQLKDILSESKKGTAKHYYGMAKSNYNRWLTKEGKGTFTPISKKYLYVFRGLLGSLYVLENNDIEPKMIPLTKKVRLETNNTLKKETEKAVEELVNYAQNDIDKLSDEKVKEYDKTINKLFKKVENKTFPQIDKKRLSKRLNKWMLDYRGMF